MTTVRPRALLLPILLALAAASFLSGINWGLPSRDADPYLFGNRAPWTGDEVMRLAGPWQPGGDRGSDRPQHAVGPTTQPTVLNATDADRAEIVRRYRLYSDQPDEMITFRSLSRMRPARGDLDPRLYQYGGLWIYPVGGLLRLAAAAHLLTLRADLAFYLDHPDAFDRFYLVARLYSAAWGLVGVVVVYGLSSELTARPLVAATAAGLYAAMPVVVNAAHEAKPHLAGTVLTLATVWAAARHVRAGQGWATAGVLAGAAAGMILTGVAAWAVLPVMAWMRPDRRLRTALSAVAIAGLTFALTNPYLPFDALFHRERLASNVGNYGTFYRPGLSLPALTNAVQLLVMGTSPAPAIVAILGAILLCVSRRARFRGGFRTSKPVLRYAEEPGQTSETPGSSAYLRAGLVERRTVPNRPLGKRGLLLAAPACWVAAQFVLLAAGKPAEYARFALTLDVAVALLAAAALPRLPLRPREAKLGGVLLVACTALYGVRYDLNFLADAGPKSTRLSAAQRLASQSTPGRTLAVTADPAPYGLPPVDLFTWRIVLLPPTGPTPDLGANALMVRPTDRTTIGLPSPISWANKPFEIVPAASRRYTQGP